MAFISSLTDWGLIRATGPDAEAFLHGQLTNDLLHLAPDAAQWSGYCTAKGRMLSGFLVWRGVEGAASAAGDNGATATPPAVTAPLAESFYLAADRSILPALVKRLSMFVLRAKVRLEDVSAYWSTYGAAGVTSDVARGPLSVRSDHWGWHIALPPIDGMSRQLTWVRTASAASFVSSSAAQSPCPLVDSAEWMRLMVHAGEPWITAATQEQYVPQMINFDAIGGISFKKGCYPGQEIVARAHYRGAVKRRMYRATVAAPAKAGDVLFASDLNGQESGSVALATPDGQGGSELLVVLQMHSQASAEVRLGSATGPVLQFAALPYALPETP